MIVENDQIFEIVQFEKLKNFQNLTIWKFFFPLTILKINILQFEKLLNMLVV